jgi:hydrogenase/urease accessory protein HupE
MHKAPLLFQYCLLLDIIIIIIVIIIVGSHLRLQHLNLPSADCAILASPLIIILKLHHGQW